MPAVNRKKYYKKEKERRAALRRWYEEYRSELSCEECGEKHPATLDCHHKNPKDKLHEVSQMIGKGYSKKSVMKEIMKCRILCSNCHRKFHWEEKRRKL